MQKPKILIVDDHTESLELLDSLLSESGYDIICSETGRNALTMIFELKPDLVLLDIMIPDIDGFELCRMIKENPATGEIPVIFLTGLSQPDSIVRGLKSGAVDYITKPYNLDEITARIDIHLDLRNAHETILKLNHRLLEYNTNYEEEVSQAIQFIRTILPEPMAAPVKIDWKFYPASHLGGDMLNYFFLRPGKLVIYILDVSGHGLVAALLSISITNILRSHAVAGVDFANPADVLNELNSKFHIENQSGRFFTLWYGVLDTGTRELIYASAGHPPAFAVRRSDTETFIEDISGGGVPVGMIDDYKYKNFSARFSENDELYLFSDGAFEILSPQDEMLGLNGLKELILRHANFDGFLLSSVIKDLRKFAGNDNFSDDFTLMRIKYKTGIS